MLLLLHLAMSVWQNLPEEVGWCLPPSACLTYLSGPVQSGPMPADSLALLVFCFCFWNFLIYVFFPLSEFLSVLFLMTGMDGLVPCPFLFFISIFTPLPLSVRPPCTTTTPCTFWIQGPQLSPQTTPCLCVFIWRRVGQERSFFTQEERMSEGKI